MENTEAQTYTAFHGAELLAEGPLEEVVLQVKKYVGRAAGKSVLVFNDSTGKTMDFDLRGTDKEVLQRLHVYLPEKSPVPSGGPGRPKLGVVAREVSLLPRHWEWLATQSGGASATIRRLIDEAKKNSSAKDRVKAAQERTYRFMSVIAGDFPHYEEALRALYAKDKKKFKEEMSGWPRDIVEQAKKWADPVFD